MYSRATGKQALRNIRCSAIAPPLIGIHPRTCVRRHLSRPYFARKHPLALFMVAMGLRRLADVSFSSVQQVTPAPDPTREAQQHSEDPTATSSRSLAQQRALSNLAARWEEVRIALEAEYYPEIAQDPFFNVGLPGLLRRYLFATSMDVDEALKRLNATAAWRKEWNVLEYYEPGQARRLFSESSNPGAEMYFADSLSYDIQGRPYVAGRLLFANAENMHPWRHLRAGVFVFELMATKVAMLGKGPASYILDIGSVGGMPGNVSGTAGADRVYDEAKNPYYAAGAGTLDAPSHRMLEEFGSLDCGFDVLKAAIHILNKHYPGTIDKVFYLNSDMLFWGAFKVFSRWIADRGSIAFQFLGPAHWREYPLDNLLDHYANHELCPEWGGTGQALDGDDFIARAIQRYEEDALARTWKLNVARSA